MTFSVKLTKTTREGSVSKTDIIYCGGGVTDPYVSDGAIRADAEAGCSAEVDNIYLVAALYFGNGNNVAERVENFPKSKYATKFAPYGCLGMNLDIYSYGRAIFTKEGYENSPLDMAGRSPTRTLYC
ncbi:hypothetical protein ACQPZF_24130 [Actinosynnema sp. CS-041913]|uniref:hypothetical protein n=1 Tax=Actinosynnema sp. CS-041913 TaxID=3239917 RepID=UPI003D8F3222